MTWKKMTVGTVAVLALLVVAIMPAQAGNMDIVEQDIVDLQGVKRQDQGRISGLPAVRLPAIAPGGRSGLVRDAVFDDAGMLALTDAIRDHARHPSRIRGYRDANTDRTFTPLASALAQYAIGD